MSRSGKIDLHIHTTVSDGTDTPYELINNLKSANVGIFSVTDHDAVKTGKIISKLLTSNDPAFITGVEFSCKDENGQYHILGYGFDPDCEDVQRIVSLGHSYRIKKVRARLDFLKSQFGFSFPEEEITHLFTLDNPGKPHIANLMVKYSYAETKDKAIEDYINCAYFANEYVRPEEAIEGIVNSGGIPILAHPFFGSGNELISGTDMENRLQRLMDFGLKGIEAFYSGFNAKMRGEAIKLAEKYNLYVTAGSDYHGKNKPITLGDTGLDREDDYPKGLCRFLEIFGI
ncbi:MAG: PHP domain-containing protein [Clostridia bacterium]|nr:PHP domain-containing protein [Clostridia bacterium]